VAIERIRRFEGVSAGVLEYHEVLGVCCSVRAIAAKLRGKLRPVGLSTALRDHSDPMQKTRPGNLEALGVP
jgi:hypothetical protein